jgi:tRNA (guanine37-N1)-methyltransferase
MKFHIITIFPEAFSSFLETSIIGRAKEKWLFAIELYKLNNFSSRKFGQVDDKAYGMHGQVLSPEPVSKAIEHIFDTLWKKVPVIYMTPSWNLLNQEWVENLSQNIQECVIICGHYEGIDQRIIELYVDLQISIGEYILSGWEIASQVLIDALVRHIPEVLWNPESLQEESFSTKLNRQKEYPVYTRPASFKGLEVPQVLRNGNHVHIETWKHNNLR